MTQATAVESKPAAAGIYSAGARRPWAAAGILTTLPRQWKFAFPIRPPSSPETAEAASHQQSTTLDHLLQTWQVFSIGFGHVGGCQNYGPFLGYNTAPII